MGGGELQLSSTGQFDVFLSGNPDISFYQYVYKKHTPFSMQSIAGIFEGSGPELKPSTNSEYIYKIERYGDLLSNIYFCFTLPEIYSSNKYKFKWIENVGSIFIKKASIYLDSMQIDQTTGEWMNVWNELIMPVDSNNKFRILVGNHPELQRPTKTVPRLTIANNKFVYNYYPESSKDKDEPSINSKQIIVPLNFWFTKNPALGLPLFRLQTQVLTLKMEFESSENLYQIYSDKLQIYISPSYYKEIHGENIDIYNFTKTTYINSFIELNYIFLGNEERNYLAAKGIMTYLVEQLTITTFDNINSKSANKNNIKIQVNNPVKEIIWTIKRNDVWQYNDYSNYSANIPESKNGILDVATLLFTNNKRFDEKNAEYFSMIQPYQYHSKIPKTGIYCYSFDLFPEKEMLAGYYNAALYETVLSLSTKPIYNNDYINSMLAKNDLAQKQYDFNYNVKIYTLNYNIFELNGGIAGMKFTLST
jgi:hypothetical protein